MPEPHDSVGYFFDAFIKFVGDSASKAETIRAEAAGESKGMNKQLVDEIDFLGERVKVFTVNGEHVRTPADKGGMGCLQFTMGMNGWAAREPMYNATGWCKENEVCLHELMSADDFMGTLVHELVERYVMKMFGLPYDLAHERFASPLEDNARRTMKSPGWSWGAVA